MKEELSKLNYAVGRSHMYWSRKPLAGIQDIFQDIKNEGDLVLDPFCGGGNLPLMALLKGGRVIAGDLNPMAIFLTKALIRSISIPALRAVFEGVADMVAEIILKSYEEKCPHCKEKAHIDYLVWSEKGNESQPLSAKLNCNRCGKVEFELSPSQTKRQLELSQIQPRHWYPKNRIKSTTRKPPVEHHFELFTGRNLTGLAELFHAIEQVSSESCRDALRYVFTAMLYSCSTMQMFSAKEPSSSRGWTAQRFYVPPKRKEKNVWNVFKNRFDTFKKCKSMINSNCFVRVTDSKDEFFSKTKKFDALLYKSDAFDLVREFGGYAQHVVLDPSYIDDVDYLAFSEFWGIWLKMKFNYNAEWHPKRVKGQGLERLLKLVHEKTEKSSIVSLLLSPKDPGDWHIREYISSSGYFIKRHGQFLYNNSNKRSEADQPKDEYFILEKKGSLNKTIQRDEIQEGIAKRDELYPYYRLTVFLNPEAEHSGGNIRSEAFKYLPARLSKDNTTIGKDVIENKIKDNENNRKAYNSLCYVLINKILSKDGWEIIYVDPAYFEDDAFEISLSEVSKTLPFQLLNRGAFLARKGNSIIRFCFDQCRQTCPKEETKRIDDQKLKDICVMIVQNDKTMTSLRKGNEARHGGFFVFFDEIREKCEEICKEEYLKLCAPLRKTDSNGKDVTSISSVKAEIIDNIPVGGDGKANHLKLRFRTHDFLKIVPGQFIMIDTSPKKRFPETVPIELNALKSSLKPKSYLKRPFGIHRAYYPGFKHDYLKNIELPPFMATIIHTVFPHEFDVFYKVLEHGVGTNEMTKLRKGDSIEILGPLGRKYDLRQLRSKGIEEVHVIGGGVGMAPLVYMVQALRFFNFKIRAFIGIESIEALKHRDDSFTENPEDVKLYVDDLKATGVDKNDIYVSSDVESDTEGAIFGSNYHHGFVSEQYKKYLNNSREQSNILAFTCGPMAMMHQIYKITDEHNIQLKVLMEKHMGCGIGVCLSCVCETTNNESDYSRVCVEGPIFDASKIVWQTID